MHDGHICDRFERSHRVRSFRHRQRGIHVTVFRKKEKLIRFVLGQLEEVDYDVERRRRSQEEETRASAFVVPVRLRHVAVVHEQRERCISDVAMTMMKIIIIIIITGRRRRRENRFRSSREKKRERGEGEDAFLESWEKTAKEEESASSSSSSTLPQIKRQHGQNESIHRIKRIIYKGDQTNQPFFCFFLSQLSFFFCADDKTDDFLFK